MEISTMELRTLDPKILQPNPANPRQTMAGDHADNQLIANIRALGILQPPVVRQENGDFIIVAGHRRVRAALALDLPEILVLLRGPTMVPTASGPSPRTSFVVPFRLWTNGAASRL